MTEAVSSTALEHIESTLNVLLPTSYRDFQETYGPVYTPDILNIVVLRKSPLIAVQEFLAPADVIESSGDIGIKGCVAFANDCSGNLFLFKRLLKAEPRLDDAPIWLFDHGSGTTNYFLYSNTPNAILTNFRKYLGTNKVEKKVRIAYRSVDHEIWTNLWPKRDIRPFDYSYA